MRGFGWVWMVWVGVLGTSLVAVADPVTPAALEGRQFKSVAVTRAGAPLDLLPGTRIELRFEAGRVSASAGGNTMGGAYTLVDGRLTIDQLAMTEMGVPPDRAEQDRWLATLLSARPSVALERGRLHMKTDDHTVELASDEGAPTAPALEGTTWRGDSMRTGDAVGHSPSMRSVVLRFAGGELKVETGLNSGSATYTIEGPQLVIGPMMLTKRGGSDEAMALERHVVTVLSSRPLGYRIEGEVLSLSGDGLGLMLRADANLFREINLPAEVVGHFPTRDGPPAAPVLLRSADEARAALGEGAERIPGFDFGTEHLVWCSWSGSSGDAFRVELVDTPEGPRVEIAITPGMTKDLVPHRHLLAVKVGTPVAYRTP